MKILHLLCSNQFSGAENVVCQIINMMRNDVEYEMVYCSPDGKIRQNLEERGITFVPVRNMTVLELHRVLRDQKPDLIHAHDMRASFIAAIACGKTPLISHIHNNNFDSRKPTVKAILYRIAAAKTKHIFWVSQSAQKGYFFHRDLEKKSTVLYNVIDAEQLRQKAEMAECQSAYDIVFIGRLTYPKNPQRLVDVLEAVVRQKPDVQAAIIGSGELEEEVKALIARKDLQNNIHCLGFMSNPYGILQNAKVMLMTSRWEGLPMCALEAMALGVPIVSTPTDGLCALVDDGDNGYLGTDDEILAEKLINIIYNSDVFDRMSGSALRKAQIVNNTDSYTACLKAQYELWRMS